MSTGYFKESSDVAWLCTEQYVWPGCGQDSLGVRKKVWVWPGCGQESVGVGKTVWVWHGYGQESIGLAIRVCTRQYTVGVAWV